MNKEKAMERIAAIEKEAAELREIVDAVDKPELEEGQVWQHAGDTLVISRMFESGKLCATAIVSAPCITYDVVNSGVVRTDGKYIGMAEDILSVNANG